MGNNTTKYNNEERGLKESYYDLFNQTIKKRYDKNRKDLFNQSYSLFAKDFQKCYINQRIAITKLAKDFIPWKSYLMRAINNLANQNGCLWAQGLYIYLSHESFPEQTKYLNMFFYQEIQILTRPKLKNQDRILYCTKGTEKIDDIFADKEDKLDEND